MTCCLTIYLIYIYTNLTYIYTHKRLEKGIKEREYLTYL